MNAGPCAATKVLKPLFVGAIALHAYRCFDSDLLCLLPTSDQLIPTNTKHSTLRMQVTHHKALQTTSSYDSHVSSSTITSSFLSEPAITSVHKSSHKYLIQNTAQPNPIQLTTHTNPNPIPTMKSHILTSLLVSPLLLSLTVLANPVDTDADTAPTATLNARQEWDPYYSQLTAYPSTVTAGTGETQTPGAQLFDAYGRPIPSGVNLSAIPKVKRGDTTINGVVWETMVKGGGRPKSILGVPQVKRDDTNMNMNGGGPPAGAIPTGWSEGEHEHGGKHHRKPESGEAGAGNGAGAGAGNGAGAGAGTGQGASGSAKPSASGKA